MAFITTNDGGRADAALVRQFRQALTERERTAVFAEVVRRHGGAVLSCCAERLWPDADAAVLAAGGVLIAARRAMADSAKPARPDLLRDWLLGIAACVSGLPGLPGGIDDIDWEAVLARVASGTVEVRAAVAERPSPQPSLRLWLERVVATLPEARQRLFDLFVTRGADSRSAARDLGMSLAGVRRLRRENRQAILRAFEITALVAAAADPVGGEAPGCGELLQVVAEAQRGGDVLGRRFVVVPAALRLAVTRHVSQCGSCQELRDECMARWAPDLLPILADAELREHVMDELRPAREIARAHAGAPVRFRSRAGAHRGAASVGASRTVVTRATAAAAGTGVLVALLLLGFVWPGLLHGAAAVAPLGSATASQDHGGGPTGGSPQTTRTSSAVPGHNHAQPVPHGTAGLLASVPAEPSGSWLTPASSASATPPLVYTVQPSAAQPSASATSSGSPSARPTSIASPTSSPAPSPSAAKPTPVPSTSPTSPAPSTPTPTTSPSSTPSASATPSPSASVSVSATAPPSTSTSTSTSTSAAAPAPAAT